MLGPRGLGVGCGGQNEARCVQGPGSQGAVRPRARNPQEACPLCPLHEQVDEE